LSYRDNKLLPERASPPEVGKRIEGNKPFDFAVAYDDCFAQGIMSCFYNRPLKATFTQRKHFISIIPLFLPFGKAEQKKKQADLKPARIIIDPVGASGKNGQTSR